jgi:hypothetical protein
VISQAELAQAADAVEAVLTQPVRETAVAE